MFGSVREIIESHYCFCKVSPYYGLTSGRRIHAGFDLDIYGVKMSRQPDPPAEFWLVYTKIKEVVDMVRDKNNHACSIAVIPFGSTVVLDTRNYLQPIAMLRIRITHNRGTQETARAAEHDALKAVEAQLSELGITVGQSQA